MRDDGAIRVEDILFGARGNAKPSCGERDGDDLGGQGGGQGREATIITSYARSSRWRGAVPRVPKVRGR